MQCGCNYVLQKLNEPSVPEPPPAASSSTPQSQSSGATAVSIPPASAKESPAEASASTKESPEDKLKRYVILVCVCVGMLVQRFQLSECNSSELHNEVSRQLGILSFEPHFHNRVH